MTLKNKHIFVVSHGLFQDDGKLVHGTGAELFSFFQKREIHYTSIFHSLFSGHASFVEEFPHMHQKWYGFTQLPFFIRLIQEQLITLFIILKRKKKIDIYIGIDPMNAFLGIILQKVGLVKKTIFYTADYAVHRYDNIFLNMAYHFFDRYAISQVNQVWNVSKRMQDKRTEQRVENKRNIFLPNTPDLAKIISLGKIKKNNYQFVIVSHLTKAINLPVVFSSIEEVKKNFSKIRLCVIGSGPEENRLQKIVKKKKLTKQILFIGSLSHDKVLQFLQTCYAGIAVYTMEKPWTMYGDSMKIREYLASGIPVITTDVPSTADEIRENQAGFVIEMNKKSLVAAMTTLLQNDYMYKKMSRNARTLAHAYNFGKLVSQAFSKL